MPKNLPLKECQDFIRDALDLINKIRQSGRKAPSEVAVLDELAQKLQQVNKILEDAQSKNITSKDVKNLLKTVAADIARIVITKIMQERLHL